MGLSKYLKDFFGVSSLAGFEIEYNACYCDKSIFDIIVTIPDGTTEIFPAYDSKRHCFPWEHE